MHGRRLQSCIAAGPAEVHQLASTPAPLPSTHCTVRLWVPVSQTVLHSPHSVVVQLHAEVSMHACDEGGSIPAHALPGSMPPSDVRHSTVLVEVPVPHCA